MQTPSELLPQRRQLTADTGTPNEPDSQRRSPESIPQERTPRRSVFANFQSQTSNDGSSGITHSAAAPKSFADRNLQSSIDSTIARSFLYRFLAKAFEYPTDEGWCWLSSADIHSIFRCAVRTFGVTPELEQRATELLCGLNVTSIEPFMRDYISTFGHAARGPCPLNEIEYGDLKADPLFQPHRLADLAAFYYAFGLELAEDADERHDHISIELEFMSVLLAKETYALEHQLDDEPLAICREAQRKFLREHLGRWTPAVTRRLAHAVGDSPLAALAAFTQEFVAGDCRRLGVTPGSEDLLLRPVDESAESLCASCGINNLPPGALSANPQM